MHITCHASVPEHNIECFQIWLYCECMGCGNADCRGSHAVMHAAHRLTHRATTAHDVLIKVCKCAAGSENRWRRGSKEGGNPAGERACADNAKLWPLTSLCSIIRGHQLIPGNGQRPLLLLKHTLSCVHRHTRTRTRPLTALNQPRPTSTLFFFSPVPFHLLLPPALHCSLLSHASLHHLAHPNISAPNLSHYVEMCQHLQPPYPHRKRYILSKYIYINSITLYSDEFFADIDCDSLFYHFP